MWPFSVIFKSPVRERLKRLRPGMIAEEVLKIMGSPDRMVGAGVAKDGDSIQIWTYRAGGKNIELWMKNSLYSHTNEKSRSWIGSPLEEGLEQIARAEGTTVKAKEEKFRKYLSDTANERLSSVYLYNETLYFGQLYRSTTGLWFNPEPVQAIEPPYSAKTLTELLMNSLASSKTNVAPNKMPTKPCSPAGIRRPMTFWRNAKHLVVHQEQDVVRLIPTKKEKSGGFSHLPDEAKEFRPGSKQIGKFVLTHFSLPVSD